MFQRIAYWLFKRAKKRQASREITFINYGHIRSAVLVFEQSQQQGIELLTRQLERDGMMVEIVGYDPKIDFTHLGKLKPQAEQALPTHPCDLLIDLSTTYHLGTQYILMAIPASFKAGLRFAELPVDDQQGILDMMVALPTTGKPLEPLDIAEQVIHYLKMINQ